MNVLRKLTLRTLFKNKKRTIVTIIGVVLATALITAVANMAVSFHASMIAYERKASGDFHYCFYGVAQENVKYFENNRNLERIGYVTNVGYAVLPGSRNPDKPYLYIRSMNDAAMQAISLKLIEGRLPENDHEIVIGNHIRLNGGVKYQIGDTIRLMVGDRETDDGFTLDQNNPYCSDEESFIPMQEAEYTVVGIMERPLLEIEDSMAPGYTVITRLEDVNQAEQVDIYATYTRSGLRNRDRVTASLLGVSEELYHRYNNGEIYSEEEWKAIRAIASYHACNIWLLKWELMLFSNTTMIMLYSMAAVAITIIIVTSVFCIRNSFVISLTEKMKLYGMLSSVGVTRKQRKQLVYQEALILGCIGIPIGILCGVIATFVVVKLTSHLLQAGLGIELIYAVSVPAMILGAILAAVTVFFSAGQSARKAAKVSPIIAIRGNETIKIRTKEVRTPGFIGRLFGIGGQIAYKNLRRARIKYRTTVISIVVSVAIFIAMSTFIHLGFRASTIYFEDINYQLRVSLYSGNSYEDALIIANLDEVESAEILRMGAFLVPTDEVAFQPQYLEQFPFMADNDTVDISVVSIGEEAYENYCDRLGLSVEETREKGILIADYKEVIDVNGESKRITGILYDYHPGDVITGTIGDIEDSSKEVSIEIAAQTDIRPVSLENQEWKGFLVVSDAWIAPYEDLLYETKDIYIQCEDADALEEMIQNDMDIVNCYIQNTRREYQETKSLYMLIAIFLYGFIIVIALIGITNIFNTITTNMELRSREFAMLKSIGMTKKEFRRMIWLESAFYGMKSLFIGIPVGILLSVCFYFALTKGLQMPYQLPYMGILISVIAVFVLLFGIMRYSMGKINRKNIIDTIQNENI